MEDGDTDGDNHSDGDSDKLGNGIVYAMRMKGRAQGFAFVLLFFALFPAFFTLHATILGGRKSVSQKSGSCRIHFRQKSENLLERGKNRHNFAVSKVKNDTAREQ